MKPSFWLASYPKSGNTWFRILLSNLVAADGPTDINAIGVASSMATGRHRFDAATMIESGLLKLDEIAGIRPRYHAFITAEGSAGTSDYERATPDALSFRSVKTHDAYTYNLDKEPVLGGAAAAAGAVLIVRDPRDVAVSLANHLRWSIDRTIDFMADRDMVFGFEPDTQNNQLDERVLDWGGFAASWLDQRDIPVHLLRYEDLQSDGPATFKAALAFLGQPVDDAAIERALRWSHIDELGHQEQTKGFAEAPPLPGHRFFRRGISGGWRGELTRDQIARIEAAHADMMQRLGYERSNAGTGPGILGRSSVIRRKGDWIAAQVGDEVVMMSGETGNYLALSGVGPRIWELTEQPRTRDELRTLLLEEFDVAPADCDAEADAFLRDLEKNGAVEITAEA